MDKNLPEILPRGCRPTIEWWESVRRPEIIKLFAENIYGITPAELPDVEYTLWPHINGHCNTEWYTLIITMKRSGKACEFRSDIYRPAKAEGALPVVIMLDSSKSFFRTKKSIYNHFPADLITSAGFIAVLAYVDEAVPDSRNAYRKGLLELYPPEGMSGWGAIGGWAFCASRVIDYLLTDSQRLSAQSVVVCGHSRAGKAALWCGAQDKRAAVTISNESGCSGAALARVKRGERILDITKKFPHWFCPRYPEFAGREEELPVDQHMLLALCAPRPVYVSSAEKDAWADPRAEFMSAVLCEKAYELYGKNGLPATEFPPVNEPILSDSVGYHVRNGRHACKVFDWKCFLKFLKLNI